MIRIVGSAVLLLGICRALTGQAAAPPAFEVASVKAAPPWKGEGYSDGYQAGMRAAMADRGMSIRGLRVNITDHSLIDLVRLAYGVKNHQVIGPAWMAAEKFDVAATLASEADRAKVPEMLQTLLAERFHLKFHREQREMPVYALVVAKGGPKLQETAPPVASASHEMEQRGAVGAISQARHLRARAATLSAFADLVTRLTDRPVVDMTAVQGKYDFDVMYSAELADATGEGAPLIANAIQQQLGLRLEARKIMMEVLVVDQVDKLPTEN